MYSCCSQLITFRVTTSVCGSYLCVCVCVCVCACVCVSHLCECFWLFPLLHHVQFGSSVPLIISDANGELRGLQPLIAVTLTATPLIDVLQEKESESYCTSDFSPHAVIKKQLYYIICLQCNQSNFVCFNKVLIWFILWVNVAYALSPA